MPYQIMNEEGELFPILASSLEQADVIAERINGTVVTQEVI